MQGVLLVSSQIDGIMKREKRRSDMKKHMILNLLLFANSILLIMYMELNINRYMAFNATDRKSVV